MADYPWFPMFVDLSDKNVLVVGGGTIGGRRAAALARFCPNVEVVSPQVGEAVRREAEAMIRLGHKRVMAGEPAPL